MLRRQLLAKNDEENVVQFSKELNLKDSCYMLADCWDLLTTENLMKAWSKVWPESKQSDDDTDENQSETLESVREVVMLCQLVPRFREWVMKSWKVTTS